jgi:hypothetical protein
MALAEILAPVMVPSLVVAAPVPATVMFAVAIALVIATASRPGRGIGPGDAGRGDRSGDGCDRGQAQDQTLHVRISNWIRSFDLDGDPGASRLNLT